MFDATPFVSHSGLDLQFKIDCDSLTPADWTALAALIAERLPPFTAVIGVPRGGLALAEAMRWHITPDHDGEPLLVLCDDVLTTGRSMEEARRAIPGEVIGVVIFSRASKVPPWIVPLFCINKNWATGEKQE